MTPDRPTPPGSPGDATPPAARSADDVLGDLESDLEEGLEEGLEALPLETKRTQASANSYPRSRVKAGKTGRKAGPGESRHSPRRIEAVKRQHEALMWRQQGASYAFIAQKMNLACAQSAWNMVESALQRTLQDAADNVRKLELERLDTLFAAAYKKATLNGDLQASQHVLNIMNRRARLQGLDMPVLTKTEVSTTPQGTIVVPAVMESDAWDKLAQAQQAEAMVDRAALDQEDKAKDANGEGAEGQAA